MFRDIHFSGKSKAWICFSPPTQESLPRTSRFYEVPFTSLSGRFRALYKKSDKKTVVAFDWSPPLVRNASGPRRRWPKHGGPSENNLPESKGTLGQKGAGEVVFDVPPTNMEPDMEPPQGLLGASRR